MKTIHPAKHETLHGIGEHILFSNPSPARSAFVQFKHSWTDARKISLSSTCLSCSAVIATNTDEISLLVAEHGHTCVTQDTKVTSHPRQIIAPNRNPSKSV